MAAGAEGAPGPIGRAGGRTRPAGSRAGERRGTDPGRRPRAGGPCPPVRVRLARRVARERARPDRVPGQPPPHGRALLRRRLLRLPGPSRARLRRGLPAKARPLRDARLRPGPAHRGPALSRCPRVGGRAQRRRELGRRGRACGTGDQGLDRSPASGRGGAGRAERGFGRHVEGDLRHGCARVRGGEGRRRPGRGALRTAAALRRVDRRHAAPDPRQPAEAPARDRREAHRRDGGGAGPHRGRHRPRGDERPRPHRLRADEPGRRRRRAPTQSRPAAACLEALPARLHPAQPVRPRHQDAPGPRDGRPPLLPDRRRQDGGLSRSRGFHHRASSADGTRPARRRRRGDHALHPAPPHPRPAGPRRRRRLRPRTDATRLEEREREGPAAPGRLADRDRSLGRLRRFPQPARG